MSVRTRLVFAGPAARPAARLVLAAGIPTLVAAVIFATSVGAVSIPQTTVAASIFRHVTFQGEGGAGAADTIVWQVRLPRVLLARMVGGTLALSGATYQSVFRNPLADPYLIGVASGAGLGAAIAIVSPLRWTTTASATSPSSPSWGHWLPSRSPTNSRGPGARYQRRTTCSRAWRFPRPQPRRPRW